MNIYIGTSGYILHGKLFQSDRNTRKCIIAKVHNLETRIILKCPNQKINTLLVSFDISFF